MKSAIRFSAVRSAVYTPSMRMKHLNVDRPDLRHIAKAGLAPDSLCSRARAYAALLRVPVDFRDDPMPPRDPTAPSGADSQASSFERRPMRASNCLTRARRALCRSIRRRFQIECGLRRWSPPGGGQTRFAGATVAPPVIETNDGAEPARLHDGSYHLHCDHRSDGGGVERR